jgi:REP element-mobilizing transposase RayT
MAQSLSNVTIHIIFSTKNWVKYLDNGMAPKLHAYVATVLRDLNSVVHTVGGTEDHIHIACSLPRTLSQSDLLKKIKVSSSKWLKDKGVKDFSWQNGYGIFSVSQSHLDKLKKYIANQSEHHKKISFKEEFLEFLKKYNLEYDERYLWD